MHHAKCVAFRTQEPAVVVMKFTDAKNGVTPGHHYPPIAVKLSQVSYKKIKTLCKIK